MDAEKTNIDGLNFSCNHGRNIFCLLYHNTLSLALFTRSFTHKEKFQNVSFFDNFFLGFLNVLRIGTDGALIYHSTHSVYFF